MATAGSERQRGPSSNFATDQSATTKVPGSAGARTGRALELGVT
jgi:hypothetical protein